MIIFYLTQFIDNSENQFIDLFVKQYKWMLWFY